MICQACKNVPHDGQPEGCRGGTWCDCNHRPPFKKLTDKENENVKSE